MAASMAISSPLLGDISISGAKGVLINFTGGHDMKLTEVNEAAKIIQEEVGNEADIIFGSVIDPSIKDEIQITVIATGFNKNIYKEKNILSANSGYNIQEITKPKNNIYNDNENTNDSKIIEHFDSTTDFDGNTIVDENDLEIPAYLRIHARMK
jgi:cell division protein FtsZ